jgi:hypothetical protein
MLNYQMMHLTCPCILFLLRALQSKDTLYLANAKAGVQTPAKKMY